MLVDIFLSFSRTELFTYNLVITVYNSRGRRVTCGNYHDNVLGFVLEAFHFELQRCCYRFCKISHVLILMLCFGCHYGLFENITQDKGFDLGRLCWNKTDNHFCMMLNVI